MAKKITIIKLFNWSREDYVKAMNALDEINPSWTAEEEEG